MEGLKYYEGKKVFIILKNKRQYSGKVVEVDDKNPVMGFIIITDKFGNRVSFAFSEIELLEEETEGK